MTINKTQNGNSLNVKVSGRLDTMTAPDLDKELSNSLNGIETLVLDFSELEYISSAGLRVLLSTQKTMNKQGSMSIKGVNETINDVFEVTGFCDILTYEKL